MKFPPNFFTNLDSNESVFFSRELTSIRARTYDVVYPEYKAFRLMPVSSEAGPGADSVVYQQFDRVGFMKLISNYADDLPRSDVKGVEFLRAVKSIGGSYGYNIQEIQAALKAGKPLTAKRAEAARKSYDQYVNQLAWLGDGTAAWGGHYGLLYHPNVGISAPTTGNWAAATPDEMIADFAKAWSEQMVATKGVEIPNTALFGTSLWTRLTTIPRTTTSDTTVLEFLKKAYPNITTWDWVNDLDSVTNTLGKKPDGTTGSTNCLVLYRNASDKFVLELPRPFEQLPPQAKGLEWVIYTFARVAGVICYYPLSVRIMQGL